MASKSQKPTSPLVRNVGLAPVQKQAAVSPAVAKQRIENRKMPDRVYDPKKVPRKQRQGQFAAPIMAAAAGGFASNTASGAASIAELARALKDDVDLIYEFVYNNIEFIPTYGSQKGALGCLIDGMGNAFDIAELMIELLREAGYTASFQLGELEILTSDAADIFGTDNNVWAINNLFAAGGIPSSTYWNWPNWYNRFTHCWVKVDIGGTDYHFDPALKSYSTVTGMNMATALDYTQSTFMTNAKSGATVNSDYVQDMHRANIRSDMDDFTDNLIDHIKTNDFDATTDDVIGGRTIDPQSGTVRDTAHPDLRSGATITTWTGDIPNTYKATLNVAYDTIDETFYSKDIHGKRLTLFFNASREAELRLDGTLIDTSSAQGVGTWNSVWLEVVHPYGTTFADEGHWQTVWAEKPYLIAQAWGNAGRGMIEVHRGNGDKNKFDGGADDDEDVFGEALAQFFHTWNTKKSWIVDTLNRMTDCKTVLHHQTGLVGHYDTPLLDLGGIRWASGALDNDWDNVDTNDTALAMFGISFEAGVFSENTELNGVSSTPLIDKANDDGIKIYDAKSSNWVGTVEPALTNYSATDKSNIKSWWIDANWRVALPEDGDLGIDDWDGYGYYAISPNYGSIGIIQGGLKGGGGAASLTESKTYRQISAASPMWCSMPVTKYGIRNPISSNQNGIYGKLTPVEVASSWRSADPVDLRSGAYLYDHVDLTLGSASFPYGLSFHRFYSSSRHLSENVLGLGWTHNHRMRAEENSDPFMGMGMVNPIEGAAGLAAMYVTVDLLNDLTKPMDKWVTLAIVHKWLNDQLKGNTVVIEMAEGNQMFTKQPDGTYTPPLGSNASLSLTAGEYILTTEQGVEFTFNTDGDIKTIDFPAGPTVTYTYSSGKLSTVTNGMGRTLTITHTSDRISSVSDGTGRSVSFTYDVDGNLETATDAEGEDTDYEYVSEGMMSKIFKPENPLDPIVTNTYDTLNRVKEQKDAYNNVTKLYLAGPRAEEEDPTGESRVVHFDRNAGIIKSVDALGNETTFEYDGIGRMTKVTAPEGNATEYEYDDDHNVKKVTAKAKSGSGLSNVVNEFTYDTTWKNKVKTAKDGLNNTVTYFYDSTKGTLTKIEFPQVGSPLVTPKVEFTYNTRGQVLTKKDPTGIVTDFTYDLTKEELEKVIVDEGTGRKNITTEFTYDTVGNVTSVKDPNLKSTSYEYDDLRRLTKVTAPAPLSYQTKFTYDKNGNRTKVERETGDVSNPWQTSTAAYDIDDLLESVTDPGSQTTSFDYNSLRLLWKTTDAASRVTTRAYDELRRLETVTDHASVVQVTNTYTDNGLLDKVKDGSNNETNYDYDGFDRLKKKTYPNSKYEELTYDANNRVTKVRNRNADEIDFTYDVLGRMTQKAPDNMPTVDFEYDLAGRRTKVKTAVVAGNPASGDFDYYYDTAGRLTKEEYPDNKSVQYEYDANGNITKVTYPDSYYIERVFDEINRLTGVKLNGATALALDFDYNKLSQRTKLTYENGVETDYGFENDGDMDSLIQTFTGSSVEFTYAFNNVHELTSQEVDDSAYMWHPASAGTVTYAAANNMNQYPTVGGTSFTYDNNGCLTDDGVFDYTYDTENQLIEADDGTTISTYIYDPMRRQNQKNVGGTKTRYLYSGFQMIAEYDGSGNIQKKYVYGSGLDEVLIELDDNDDPKYLHHDRMGSIIATSDDTGAVINKYAYSPFGESGSLTGTTFGYTGQRYDPETGLYYYKNRHYSVELGRFLQPDPTGYADSLNIYQYGFSDPNTFSDPLGLAADGSRNYSDIAAAGAAAGAASAGGRGIVGPGGEGGLLFYSSSIAHLGFGGPALGTFLETIIYAPGHAPFNPNHDTTEWTYKVFVAIKPVVRDIIPGDRVFLKQFGWHASIIIESYEDGVFMDVDSISAGRKVVNGKAYLVQYEGFQLQEDLAQQLAYNKMLPVPVPAQYSGDSKAFADALYAAANSYDNSAEYDAVPAFPNQYNSNSFVSGILKKTGARRPRFGLARIDGYGRPLPL